jgi:hypothetical protein
MTMRTFILILGIAFSILLIGCALSINPIIPESDAIFDTRLLGNWKDISSSDQASISRGTANSYEIEYTSDGKTGRFEARLGHLGEHLILDVWPKPHIGDISDPYADMLITGHLQLFLEVSDNEIAVATIDPDSLLSALQSGKVKLPYKNSTEFILTGTTEELRKNLVQYIANPKVLTKREVWRRDQHSTATTNLPVNVPCFEASAWREADQIFRRDPHWVGADVASSVDLGGHRTLWLFGDT